MADIQKKRKNVWSHLAGIWTQPARVCPAYLPPGCHIHGNVTSNNVESFNYMAMCVRRSTDLLASLLTMLHLQTRRHQAAYNALPAAVRDNLVQGSTLTKATEAAIRVQDEIATSTRLKEGEVCDRTRTFTSSARERIWCLIQRVLAFVIQSSSLDCSIFRCSLLVPLKQIKRSGQTYLVPSTDANAGAEARRAGAPAAFAGTDHYVVDPRKTAAADWDNVCNCGYVSTRYVMCKHVYVVHNFAHDVPIDMFVKPWCTEQAVHRQLGSRPLTVITWQAVLRELHHLKASNILDNCLRMAQLRLRPAGRPKGLTNDVLKGNKRLKSAGESSSKAALLNDSVREVMGTAKARLKDKQSERAEPSGTSGGAAQVLSATSAKATAPAAALHLPAPGSSAASTTTATRRTDAVAAERARRREEGRLRQQKEAAEKRNAKATKAVDADGAEADAAAFLENIGDKDDFRLMALGSAPYSVRGMDYVQGHPVPEDVSDNCVALWHYYGKATAATILQHAEDFPNPAQAMQSAFAPHCGEIVVHDRYGRCVYYGPSSTKPHRVVVYVKNLRRNKAVFPHWLYPESAGGVPA